MGSRTYGQITQERHQMSGQHILPGLILGLRLHCSHLEVGARTLQNEEVMSTGPGGLCKFELWLQYLAL